MASALVVGGGIAGILAALQLKKSVARVTLVEKAPELGGLLRSVSAPDGTRFDLGTHLPAETGHAELDALLLGGIRRELGAWRTHSVVRAGNYFSGRLNAESPCLDLRDLPGDVSRRGLEELLAAPADAGNPATLREQLDRFYGPTVATRAFEPALRKFFGRGTDELAPGAHLLFILPRLIAFDPEKARALKKDPRLDAKLSFHSYREPPSTVASFYPKAGGVGRWVELLGAELASSGVEVRLGDSVAALEDGGRRARLASGGVLDCDPLVWTIPLFECLKAAGVTAPSAPPSLRQTTLTHLVFDRPFETDLHYAACYDPRFASFRVTLYPNMRGDGAQAAPYNCTVETLGAPGEAAASPDAVAAELTAMGFVSPSARRLWERTDRVPGGFPVLTPAFRDACAIQLDAARRALPSALFFGKARGTSFFMPDVLKEAHRELEARAGAPRS